MIGTPLSEWGRAFCWRKPHLCRPHAGCSQWQPEVGDDGGDDYVDGDDGDDDVDDDDDSLTYADLMLVVLNDNLLGWASNKTMFFFR